MKEIKLSTVLIRAQRIAIEEERRIIVYRDENDVWTMNRYIPFFLQLEIRQLQTVILINAYTGYETITTVETVIPLLPWSIL